MNFNTIDSTNEQSEDKQAVRHFRTTFDGENYKTKMISQFMPSSLNKEKNKKKKVVVENTLSLNQIGKQVTRYMNLYKSEVNSKPKLNSSTTQITDTTISFDDRITEREDKQIKTILKDQNEISVTVVSVGYHNPYDSLRNLKQNYSLCNQVTKMVSTQQQGKQKKFFDIIQNTVNRTIQNSQFVKISSTNYRPKNNFLNKKSEKDHHETISSFANPHNSKVEKDGSNTQLISVDAESKKEKKGKKKQTYSDPDEDEDNKEDIGMQII